MKKLVALLCLSSLAHADPTPCTISTPQDVLACALAQHPDVLLAKSQVEAAGQLERFARQQPNPEADAQSTSFSENSEPGLKLEANLLHTFELGGKKSKRISEARAQKSLAEAELLKAQEQVALKTVLNLYRLRQLRLEMQTLDEGIHTFAKVVQAFQSRAVRSAEQEVSLNVFALAKSEQSLRKSSLLQERAALQAYFETIAGIPFEKVTAVLPAERRTWPEIPSVTSIAQSAERRDAEAHLQFTETQRASAQSVAWPDMKLGPRLEYLSGHGQSAQGYGLALALPLPLYQRNEGGKRAAQAQVDVARLVLTQKEKELEAERRKWSLIYQQALTTYKEEPSLDDIQKKHHSLETLFERGLVSATLVIEAHRQVAEFVKSRHEQESHALEALWSLYALNGTILKESL